MTIDRAYTIQPLLWPEADFTTETELYARASQEVSGLLDGSGLTFAKGGSASFDTAANLFNLGKWHRHCDETDIILRLDGAGSFTLQVTQSWPDQKCRILVDDTVHLAIRQPHRVDVTSKVAERNGVLWFRIVAHDHGHLTGAAWETSAAPRRLPKLALSITTFKREEAIQRSVARFDSFLAQTAFAEHLHLFVVDNGMSANIQPSDHVTPIPSHNLGGSGGFARGLLAALNQGATHCLFMDDDAAIQMPVLDRTWTFLAYARNLDVAVAGGITMANFRSVVWESGAIYDRVCRPQWLGTDLCDFDQVLQMEVGSTGAKPENFYGGWWYFAFPLAHVTHQPFPFFVRGDDISFSIANKFEIVTLPGVICFQDADFSDKESLNTLYLDLRSHMAHHLALPQLDIGLFGVLSIPARFFARAMMQNHHDTMSALNLSLKDALRGPDFFAQNADMSVRRADLAKMRDVEAWKPLTGPPPASRRRFDPRKNATWRKIMKYSLNGYLLPFFSFWGNSVTLEAGQRGQLHEVWGAARVTYVSADGTQAFTVRHSKLRALREGLTMMRSMAWLAWNYRKLCATWRKGYNDLTTRDFWPKMLELDSHQSADAEKS